MSKANDDGEPSGSAGMPILGQLKSHHLINVGCVVVRYYGGTKLGVPGLIAAYKNSCIGAIQENEIIPYNAIHILDVSGAYSEIMKFMTLARQQRWNIRYIKSESKQMVQLQIEEEILPLVMDKLSLFSSLTCI